jgi:flagellar hook protein FlgE
MSILNAMYTGVSGLDAEGEALGVIGHNVSNANTVGFKESRSVFENVMGSALGDATAVGAGVRMDRTQQIFAQGAMLNTGQATDLAISGDGFFVVHGNVNGVTGNFFTRAGQTSLDKNGTLVNPDGLGLQGYKMLPSGQLSSQLGPITLQTAALSPKMTTKMTVTANLSANATTPTLPWNAQNPSATSNFSTTLNVYDSLGNAHQVDVHFRQTAANTWDYHVLANGSEVQGGTAGQNTEFASGSLTFNTNGALQQVTSNGGSLTFNNAQAQTIAINFGTSIAAGGTGLDGTTQFGSPSVVSSQGQDGYSSGDLSGVKISQDGTVSGVYSNGQSVAVGQLAMAKFVSNDGLAQAGQNLWAATQQSGDPALGAAGAGGRGAIVTGSLEQSNVDIAAQFVDLIAHQRSFQASSKTITTADQMLQELMQIKQ